ncbi:MAG TPA: glycogen-binding domain-containing protein [Verrucomicrobiae bacterium]|nr:glycogen-binding domain-containing protein [Verrucomicrobiae bacterium]
MPKVEKNARAHACCFQANADSERRPVSFILSCPGAEEVCLCGDFNEWSRHGLPMIRRGDSHLWEKRLMLLPGRYEYKFIVNGVWIHNPNAAENVFNIYGSMNSVIEVDRECPTLSTQKSTR